MEQTSEPVVLSQMIIDCNTQIEHAYHALTNVLMLGKEGKRTILESFKSFELNCHLSCDIAEKALAFAIGADTGATASERDDLLTKVRGIERRWMQMAQHVEEGIKLFGVVHVDTFGSMH